jgi:anaphase-promoting complex subunit 7
VGRKNGRCSAGIKSLKKEGFTTAAAEAEIKYKIALCQLKLKENQDALATLESVPCRNRTLAVNLTMGQLYHQQGVERGAIACYKDALRQNPYCLEAIPALLQLAVPEADIKLLLAGTTVNQQDTGWLQEFVSAHTLVAKHEYKKAAESFLGLEKVFGQNTNLLTLGASCQMYSAEPEHAIATFARTRQIDECCMDNMDQYADLVKVQGSLAELNRLTHDLMAIDSWRPEAWVSASKYWELKGDNDKSMELVDKALQIDARHNEAHLHKGHLHAKSLRHDQALLSFRRAYSCRKDMRAFQGLVKAYVASQKYKEALQAAKEALMLMPRNPKALTLVGMVLSQTPEGQEKAKKAFEKAQKIDPRCIDTVMALVDLLMQQENTTAAIEVLNRALLIHNKDTIHAKLAQVLTQGNNFTDALVHFHTALSLNPHNESARRDLERLEKVLKGQDPDAEEEEADETEGEPDAEESFESEFP